MATRKHIFDAFDRLEGKKEGSSHAALNKERVRQGYKPEGAKHSALKKRTKVDKFGASTGGGFREGQCVNCGKHTKGGACPTCDKR